MWAYGMDPPKGLIENTGVGSIVADALGVDIRRLTNSLYVDLDTTDMSYEVDVSDVTNWHATVEGCVFPLGMNFFLVNDRRQMLKGITVYAPATGKLYISSEAIEMVKSLM